MILLGEQLFTGAGTLNSSQEKFSGLQYPTQRYKFTFCSSIKCAGRHPTNNKGKLINSGNSFIYKCPRCLSDEYLVFEVRRSENYDEKRRIHKKHIFKDKK